VPFIAIYNNKQILVEKVSIKLFYNYYIFSELYYTHCEWITHRYVVENEIAGQTRNDAIG